MGTESTATRERVEDIATDWPEKPRNLPDQIMDQYRVPDEVTTQRLIWQNVGEWKRVQYRDGTPHNVLKLHQDHLRQTIDYPIDPEFADDLIAFDGSNKLYRTRGELAADCHKESMNVLTLNLTHDVITGEKMVDEARQAFAETAIKAEMGRGSPYTEEFQFDVPQGDQGDPDESIITDAMKQRVKETIDDVAGGEV